MLSEREVVGRVKRVTVRRLRAWVRRGWIQPLRHGDGVGYTEADVARARLICDLSDIMEIRQETVPVVLNLLDQIHGLRHELRVIMGAIESLPPEMRAAVKARLEAQLEARTAG